MLSLPLNRGSSVDIKSGFATLLQSQYCDNFAEKLNPDIIGYQKLRDNCVLISEPSETSIQTILRLHLHYSNFVPRLNGYQSELRVQFQWIDGFRSSKSAMSNCLFVDWACMLWNLAALESQLGARMERGTDEGVKNASKHFQQAAGIIDFILTGVFPYCSINPLSALTHTGLTMGRDLMLAQAQLCFFEKAVRDKNAGKMKPGVVAKLAIQTAAYFDQVKASCIQEPLNTTLDPSWLHHTDFQSACLHAAADYWQGLASKEVAVEKGSGYAEEIARLTRAERTLTHAIATAQKNRVSASASGDGLLNIIKTTKAKAIADNSSVYMESVPSEASLSVIPPASLVKLAPIPEISFTENIFFRDVLPSQVRQLRGDFHNQMDIILTNASTEAGTASTAARATLSDLGLPSSLEAYKFGGKLPDNLWTKISRIQNMGQKAELISKLGLLEVAAGRCVHSMATIFESLQQEERVDATFRDRFPQWDGVSSAALCVDLRSTWSLLKEAFAQAQDKDRAAKAELNDSDFDQQLMMLSKSRNEISALLPSAVAATGGVDTSGLEAKLVEMATIIEHRERALAALEQLSNRDISDLLLAQCTVKGASEQSVALASVVDDLVESAKPHVDFIQSSIVRQQTLLADIDHANLQFVQAQSSDPLTQQRNSALQQMEQALTRFQNLHAQLLAGLTFYANFQSRLSGLQQSADDLSFSQQLQRHEFEANSVTSFQRQEQEQRDLEMAESLSKEFSAQASVQPSNGMTETGRNSTGSPPGHSAYPNLNFGPSISSTPGAYTQGYPQTQNSASPRDIAYGKPISGPPQQQQMNTLTPAPYLPQQSQQQYPPQQHAQYPPQQYAPSYQYQPQSPSTVYAPPGTQPVVSPPPYQQQYQPQQYQPQQYLPTQPQPTADLHSRALRLVEMGFPYDQCMQALSANGGNEEAALNSLLSSSASSGATSSPPVSTTAPTRLSATSAPQKPPKAGAGTGAGLYGNPWGRN